MPTYALMKPLFLTIIFLFYAFVALSQPTQTLRGRVVDRKSKYLVRLVLYATIRWPILTFS